jgi:tRNA dimethylallyltransferase
MEIDNKIRKIKPLVVLIGPSAVGKTKLSIDLAEHFDAEIVSADSTLVYRGMDIGTAKPSRSERRRIPHHMIDIANPDETWTLARFQDTARKSINEIYDRNRLPMLVGGTGQYIRAITQGWRPPGVIPDQKLREVLYLWKAVIGSEGLHHRLSVVDPKAAEGIDYRNVRRTVRALEVIFLSGKRFSEQRKSYISPYNILLVGLTRPRDELYERVDQRIQQMFDNGFVEEVSSLLDDGYATDLPAFSAIGYREVSEFLQGRITKKEAIERIKRRTRVFIRHQANWFKRSDEGIIWVDVTEDTLNKLISIIDEWLSKLNLMER